MIWHYIERLEILCWRMAMRLWWGPRKSPTAQNPEDPQ